MIAPCEMQLMLCLCVVLKIKRHGSVMEPTEVVKAAPVHKHCTLRLKGGGDHEPVDKQAYTVPRLSAQNFMWNGQPSATLMGYAKLDTCKCGVLCPLRKLPMTSDSFL